MEKQVSLRGLGLCVMFWEGERRAGMQGEAKVVMCVVSRVLCVCLGLKLEGCACPF